MPAGERVHYVRLQEAGDEQVVLVALDEPLTALLDAQFEEDLLRSGRIRALRWEERNLPQRVAEPRRPPCTAGCDGTSRTPTRP